MKDAVKITWKEATKAQKGLRKAKKTVIHNSRDPYWESNQAPSEYRYRYIRLLCK
jgi:hypothetical protein